MRRLSTLNAFSLGDVVDGGDDMVLGDVVDGGDDMVLGVQMINFKMIRVVSILQLTEYVGKHLRTILS